MRFSASIAQIQSQHQLNKCTTQRMGGSEVNIEDGRPGKEFKEEEHELIIN
jgi:starvation-inducible outer membrane lipoprotein